MSRQMFGIFFVLSALCTTAANAADSVWQWSTPVNSVRGGYGPAVAYLWIPPDCQRVRGILIAQNNMEGNKFMLTPIPPRAKFPVKVTVVAWQYGHSAEPALKSAESVERSFLISK